MVELNMLKIISVIKKLLELALFTAFLYMTMKALCNLFSSRTTLITSKERRNVTFLPAFSVCDNWNIMVDGFDKKDLANGLMGKGIKLPFAVSFRLTLTMNDDFVSMNLKNESAIQNYIHVGQIEKMWTLQCKPFTKWYEYCMPCITFNGAQLKQSHSTVMVHYVQKSRFHF